MIDALSTPQAAITIGGLAAIAVGFGGFVAALVRALDWVTGRSRSLVAAAVDPLVIKVAALELKLGMTEKDLADYKVEAARTFVCNDAMVRFEERFDEGVSALRTDIAALRDALFKALTEGRSPRAR